MHALCFSTFVGLAITFAQASDLSGAHAGLGRFERRARHVELAARAPASRKSSSKKVQAKAAAVKKAAVKKTTVKAKAQAASKKASRPAPAPSTGRTPPPPASASNGAWSGQSRFVQQGSSGVSGMQLTVVDQNSVVILDKSEHNPLNVAGHPAWGQWMNVKTGKSTPLNLLTNSFCGGGAWLSNGTLVSFGGNPTTNNKQFHDGNGLQSVRIFPKCDDNGCAVYENPDRIRLTSPRWYGSAARLNDGSIMIAGGMTAGGFNNVPSTDNPTIEFFPPKSINNGRAIYSNFLHDALLSNLFPIMYTMPDGRVFMASNKLAQLYNWQSNTEQRLPSLPMRVTYPWSAASTLLPLTPENNYTPTMLFCGGSNHDDRVPAFQMSSQMPTWAGCATLDMTDAGIAAGWQQQDSLPEGRTMGEAVIMPDGKVLILNGAHTGVAGYGNVHDPVGASNADHPLLRPVIYDPTQPAGKRINANFPSASVPRMYHSSATLLPDGRVMILGSNPNADVSNMRFQTEYRIEYFLPPYYSMSRPSFSGLPRVLGYGGSFTLQVSLPSGTQASQVSVALMDLGYHTHGVSMDMRYLKLAVQSLSGNTLTFAGPPNAGLFPPGIGFLYVLANGVPSVGQKILVGGNQPPVNSGAIANMLDSTAFITKLSSITAQNITDSTGSSHPSSWNPDQPTVFDEGSS